MIELAHLPNLHGLVELANRDGVDIRPTLLRVMTDLYVQKPVHSDEEQRHFTELALRLIDLVDAPTRAIVAGKIAGYPPAPAAVRQRLLREMIAIGPTAEPAADADRPNGSDAAAVADELSELFLQGSAEDRRLILLNLPYAPLKLAAPVPPAVARQANLRLEAAALAHNGTLFAREIESALSLPHQQARRLAGDASGEPLVVVAVALAMPAAVLQRILLCLNPVISQSVQRVYDLVLLHEEIELESALRLIAIWQASGTAEQRGTGATHQAKAHQPQLWPDDGRRSASPFTRPKVRWDEHSHNRHSESG
jgi:hypothetical protein